MLNFLKLCFEALILSVIAGAGFSVSKHLIGKLFKEKELPKGMWRIK